MASLSFFSSGFPRQKTRKQISNCKMMRMMNMTLIVVCRGCTGCTAGGSADSHRPARNPPRWPIWLMFAWPIVNMIARTTMRRIPKITLIFNGFGMQLSAVQLITKQPMRSPSIPQSAVDAPIVTYIQGKTEVVTAKRFPAMPEMMQMTTVYMVPQVCQTLLTMIRVVSRLPNKCMKLECKKIAISSLSTCPRKIYGAYVPLNLRRVVDCTSRRDPALLRPRETVTTNSAMLMIQTRTVHENSRIVGQID